MSLRSAFALILACPLALVLAACGDARCDPSPVGGPWKDYESLLPDAAVICGPNRSSEKQPLSIVDDYPPTQVFVFYEEKDAAAAFERTLEKFEGAGWEVTMKGVIGDDKAALFDGAVSKDGVTISFRVNRNDWGTQGSFKLKLPNS